jgi:hypothetical protein
MNALRVIVAAQIAVALLSTSEASGAQRVRIHPEFQDSQLHSD